MKQFSPVLFSALAGLAAFALPAAPLHAQEADEIVLKVDGPVDNQKVLYECRDAKNAEPEPLTVEYYNTPNNNLAVLEIDGTPRVFVSTLAAAGAKYVSGPDVWWTRGARGDLYDERRSDASETTVCRVSGD